MILNTMIAFLAILGLLAGWIFIQQWARTYAARHPEFGPAREEGGGCLFCLCPNRESCRKLGKGAQGKGVKTVFLDSAAESTNNVMTPFNPVSNSPNNPFENANPRIKEKKP